MNTILSIALSAASTLLLWLILGRLKVIAGDTAAKEELADTIKKFAKIAGTPLAEKRGRKVVEFEARDDDV